VTAGRRRRAVRGKHPRSTDRLISDPQPEGSVETSDRIFHNAAQSRRRETAVVAVDAVSRGFSHYLDCAGIGRYHALEWEIFRWHPIRTAQVKKPESKSVDRGALFDHQDPVIADPNRRPEADQRIGSQHEPNVGTVGVK